MAHEKFRAEVLTPEGEVFNDEVELVSTKTAVGSIGILAHHEPVLAMLDPTELRLYKTESEVVRFAQAEGYLQVGDNRALILVEEAASPASSTPAASASGCSRPNASSSRRVRTPRSGGRRSGTSARLEAFLSIADG